MLPNLDTDRIIPKQFLKSVRRSGFGVNLFDEMRYHDKGVLYQKPAERVPRAEFVLNKKRYTGASILIAGANFGCGSSREHAVWALDDFGIRVIIAPSFADIFIGNCGKNGLLCIAMDPSVVNRFADACEKGDGLRLNVDLAAQKIHANTGETFSFDTDPLYRKTLLNGLDDIGLSLQESAAIRAYEGKLLREYPWLKLDSGSR